MASSTNEHEVGTEAPASDARLVHHLWPRLVQRQTVSLARTHYPLVRESANLLGWRCGARPAKDADAPGNVVAQVRSIIHSEQSRRSQDKSASEGYSTDNNVLAQKTAISLSRVTAPVVLWIDGWRGFEFRRLGQGRRTNHFPGTREICNKCALAGHLNRLRSAQPEWFDFFPPSFVLPSDRRKLAAFWNACLVLRAERRKQRHADTIMLRKSRAGSTHKSAGRGKRSRTSSRSTSPRASRGLPLVADTATPMVQVGKGPNWTIAPSAEMAFIAKPDQGAQGRGIELFLDPRPLLEHGGGHAPVGDAIAQCVARSVRGRGGGSDEEGDAEEDGGNEEGGSGTDEDTGEPSRWQERAARANRLFMASSAAATAAATAKRQGVGVSSWANAGITRALVQSYVPRPLLLDGHKFDLRIYLLVTSVFPTLRAFLYADGLVRFATQPYQSPTSRNLRKKTGHLTNYSINKGKEMATVVRSNEHRSGAASPEEDTAPISGECADRSGVGDTEGEGENEGDAKYDGDGLLDPDMSDAERAVEWEQARERSFGAKDLLYHDEGLKWGLRALWPALRARGYDADDAWRQIRRIAALVLASIAPILAHEYCAAAPGGGAASAQAQQQQQRTQLTSRLREAGLLAPGVDPFSDESSSIPHCISGEQAVPPGSFGTLGGLGVNGQSFGHHCFELLGLDVMLEESHVQSDKSPRNGSSAVCDPKEDIGNQSGPHDPQGHSTALKPLRCLLIEVNQAPSLAASADVDKAIKGRLITDSMLLTSATEPWLEAWGEARDATEHGLSATSAPAVSTHMQKEESKLGTTGSTTVLGMFAPPSCVAGDEFLAQPVSDTLVAACTDASIPARNETDEASRRVRHGLTAPALTEAMQRNLRFRWSWEDECLPLTGFERLLPCEAPGEEMIFQDVLARIPEQLVSRSSSRLDTRRADAMEARRKRLELASLDIGKRPGSPRKLVSDPNSSTTTGAPLVAGGQGDVSVSVLTERLLIALQGGVIDSGHSEEKEAALGLNQGDVGEARGAVSHTSKKSRFDSLARALQEEGSALSHALLHRLVQRGSVDIKSSDILDADDGQGQEGFSAQSAAELADFLRESSERAARAAKDAERAREQHAAREHESEQRRAVQRERHRKHESARAVERRRLLAEAQPAAVVDLGSELDFPGGVISRDRELSGPGTSLPVGMATEIQTNGLPPGWVEPMGVFGIRRVGLQGSGLGSKGYSARARGVTTRKSSSSGDRRGMVAAQGGGIAVSARERRRPGHSQVGRLLKGRGASIQARAAAEEVVGAGRGFGMGDSGHRHGPVDRPVRDSQTRQQTPLVWIGSMNGSRGRGQLPLRRDHVRGGPGARHVAGHSTSRSGGGNGSGMAARGALLLGGHKPEDIKSTIGPTRIVPLDNRRGPTGVSGARGDVSVDRSNRRSSGTGITREIRAATEIDASQFYPSGVRSRNRGGNPFS